jgi:DNA-binding NtrC family response regulator
MIRMSAPISSPTDFRVWLAASILGNSPVMARTRAAIERAARKDYHVLIEGETGTGKDLAAHAIHAGSRRAGSAAQVLSVAGLGDTAASILFGHARGAFTGATNDHKGVFACADASSLILEDISDLPVRLQPMFLRAVELGRFRAVGAPQEQTADVRVLATTNMSLEREVKEGRFRNDLYHRLKVLRIEMPPLRAHPEDIPIYLENVLERIRRREACPVAFSPSAIRLLMGYAWPGNVRELAHFVLHAAVECERGTVGPLVVERLLHRPSEGSTASAGDDPDAVASALRETDGNKRAAARRLGISPGKLYRLLRRCRLGAGEPRPVPDDEASIA